MIIYMNNIINYYVILYIVIILTLSQLKINFIENNKIIIDKLNEMIFMDNLIIKNREKYLSNKFDIILVLRILYNSYIGYNREEKIFIYEYILIYIRNIIIEIVIIISGIESNIIINPLIMTISDYIFNIIKNNDQINKVHSDKYMIY